MYHSVTSSATRTATDTDGHGSHTASTIAGNRWQAPFGGGAFAISGVAPDANVIALAAFAHGDCATTCTFARTVRSTSLADHSYDLAVSGLPVGAASVSPASLSVAAGGTATLTLTIDGSLLDATWNFGRIEIATDDVLLPTLHMPIVARP